MPDSITLTKKLIEPKEIDDKFVAHISYSFVSFPDGTLTKDPSSVLLAIFNDRHTIELLNRLPKYIFDIEISSNSVLIAFIGTNRFKTPINTAIFTLDYTSENDTGPSPSSLSDFEIRAAIHKNKSDHPLHLPESASQLKKSNRNDSGAASEGSTRGPRTLCKNTIRSGNSTDGDDSMPFSGSPAHKRSLGQFSEPKTKDNEIDIFGESSDDDGFGNNYTQKDPQMVVYRYQDPQKPRSKTSSATPHVSSGSGGSGQGSRPSSHPSQKASFSFAKGSDPALDAFADSSSEGFDIAEELGSNNTKHQSNVGEDVQNIEKEKEKFAGIDFSMVKHYDDGVKAPEEAKKTEELFDDETDDSDNEFLDLKSHQPRLVATAPVLLKKQAQLDFLDDEENEFSDLPPAHPGASISLVPIPIQPSAKDIDINQYRYKDNTMEKTQTISASRPTNLEQNPGFLQKSQNSTPENADEEEDFDDFKKFCISKPGTHVALSLNNVRPLVQDVMSEDDDWFEITTPNKVEIAKIEVKQFKEVKEVKDDGRKKDEELTEDSDDFNELPKWKNPGATLSLAKEQDSFAEFLDENPTEHVLSPSIKTEDKNDAEISSDIDFDVSELKPPTSIPSPIKLPLPKLGERTTSEELSESSDSPKNSPIKTEKTEAATEKAETIAEKAETITEKAETITEKAETITEKAETITEKAETITEKAETITEKADATIDKLEKPLGIVKEDSNEFADLPKGPRPTEILALTPVKIKKQELFGDSPSSGDDRDFQEAFSHDQKLSSARKIIQTPTRDDVDLEAGSDNEFEDLRPQQKGAPVTLALPGKPTAKPVRKELFQNSSDDDKEFDTLFPKKGGRRDSSSERRESDSEKHQTGRKDQRELVKEEREKVLMAMADSSEEVSFDEDTFEGGENGKIMPQPKKGPDVLKLYAEDTEDDNIDSVLPEGPIKISTSNIKPITLTKAQQKRKKSHPFPKPESQKSSNFRSNNQKQRIVTVVLPQEESPEKLQIPDITSKSNGFHFLDGEHQDGTKKIENRGKDEEKQNTSQLSGAGSLPRKTGF